MLKISIYFYRAKKSYKEREFGDHEFLKPGHEPYFARVDVEVYVLAYEEYILFIGESIYFFW
jgi:hypothetical protein